MRCSHAARMAAAIVVAVCAAAPAARGDGREEVREIVREMMSDARSRGSLVGGNAGASYRDGFRLEAPGGASMRINGILQMRYFDSAGVDERVGGFQSRRTRLDFRGDIGDPGIAYRLRWDFSRTSGRAVLLDAFAEYEFAPGWSVRAGQFTVPFDREFFTAPESLMLVDRSIVSSVFRVNRSQGVMMAYRGDRVRGFFTLDDGRAGLNTDFANPDVADVGLTARLEWRLGGARWSQYATHSGRPGDERGAMIGAAGHYQHDGSTGAPAEIGREIDLDMYTADVSIEGGGFSIIAGASGRVFEGSRGSAHDVGGFVQGGVFVTEEIEAYARYAHVFPGGRDAGDDADFAQATLGCNWYPLVGSRALRLTAEASYFTRPASSFGTILRAPDTTLGLLPDDDGGQLSVVFQAQIVF